MNIYIIIFIIIFIIWLFILFKFKKRYKISPIKKTFFNKQLKTIINLNSYKEQIIDIDKLYHKILLELWYKWTFWEILKQKPNQISDIKQIWDFHKFRNKLVHDFDFNSEKLLKEIANKYIIEVKKLLKN